LSRHPLECGRPDHQRAENQQERKSGLAQRVGVKVQSRRNRVQRERDKGERHHKTCCDESRPSASALSNRRTEQDRQHRYRTGCDDCQHASE
jgi:hypothetical protein